MAGEQSPAAPIEGENLPEIYHSITTCPVVKMGPGEPTPSCDFEGRIEKWPYIRRCRNNSIARVRLYEGDEEILEDMNLCGEHVSEAHVHYPDNVIYINSYEPYNRRITKKDNPRTGGKSILVEDDHTPQCQARFARTSGSIRCTDVAAARIRIHEPEDDKPAELDVCANHLARAGQDFPDQVEVVDNY